jgi:hypothetical protein
MTRKYWATVVRPGEDGMFAVPEGWRLHSVTGYAAGIMYVILEPDI